MSTERIHIVGPPRSGTTLMQALFATGFDIDGVTAHEEGLWRRRPRGERILLTKCPGDEVLAPLLLPLDRHLWFVFMLRDPRDVVVSEHGQEPGKYWSNLRVWREALQFHAKMKHHPRFVVVRYEDVVSRPDAIQEELVRRMPFLKPAVPFSRYHEYLEDHVSTSEQFNRAMRGVRPVTPDSIAAWRDHLPRVKAQLALHGGIAAELVEMGYERDNSWQTQVDNVPHDQAECLVPDQLPSRRRVQHVIRRWMRTIRYVYRRYIQAGGHTDGHNGGRGTDRGTVDAYQSTTWRGVPPGDAISYIRTEDGTSAAQRHRRPSSAMIEGGTAVGLNHTIK